MLLYIPLASVFFELNTDIINELVIHCIIARPLQLLNQALGRARVRENGLAPWS